MRLRKNQQQFAAANIKKTPALPSAGVLDLLAFWRFMDDQRKAKK